MKNHGFGQMLVMVAAALVLVTVLPVLAQSAETIQLRVSDPLPSTHFLVTEGIKPWMDRVVQLSKTKVEFKYFPSGQLGKLMDQLNLIRTGVVDIGYSAPGGLTGDFPINGFFFLPGLFENTIEATQCLQYMQKEGLLLEEYKEKDLHMVLDWVIPLYDVFTVNKAIVKLEDFKGLKIRAAGASMGKLMSALGAVPISIPGAELATALQRGTVDGTMFAYLSARSYSLQEQVKYATLGARLSSAVMSYSMLEETWQKLPNDVREAMIKAKEDVVKSVCNYQEEETIKTVSMFEKAGIKINRLSPEEKARWDKELAPLIEEWAKEMDSKGRPGTQVVNLYKKWKASMGR